VTDAGSLMRGQDAFDRIEEQFNEALDESLHPAGPEVLYEYVAAMELPAGATAIDVGCGQGEQAIELSRRFGLHVTGIDPVPRCVEAARGYAQPGDKVSFDVGAAENLPIASASADLVWCRDVLIRDPDRYVTRFGKQNYDIKLGDCLWHIYRMIGKLSSRVYLLSAPG
jgi:ubiquinone/menaquinone biosynthesis C-methylase UbiE